MNLLEEPQTLQGAQEVQRDSSQKQTKRIIKMAHHHREEHYPPPECHTAKPRISYHSR